MTISDLKIRSLSASDREWVRRKTIAEWGSEIVVVHGEIFHPENLPGFATEMNGEIVGLLTYRLEAVSCEVMTLNSWRQGIGVGTALLDAARLVAGKAGCRRFYLVTTNDNLNALRFYQKYGFIISAVRVNALAESRRLKPEIPLLGEDGIPLRDEIELEILLE